MFDELERYWSKEGDNFFLPLRISLNGVYLLLRISTNIFIQEVLRITIRMHS